MKTGNFEAQDEKKCSGTKKFKRLSSVFTFEQTRVGWRFLPF
jgi:hypothetical protein